jgi:hypothetical protein
MSYSEAELRQMFLSMAKIGNTMHIDFQNPVIPTVTGKPLDPIKLPSELSRLKGYNIDLSWNYVADHTVSKFIFYARNEDIGIVLDGAFTIIDNNFTMTRMMVLWNGVSAPLEHVEDISLSRFLELLDYKGSQGFEDLISFVKDHYKLNQAQEYKLRH